MNTHTNIAVAGRIPDLLERLSLLSLTVRLRAEEEAHLPAFLGSTIRGALASSLKRTVCVMSHRDCQKCLLAGTCHYPTLYETRSPRGDETLERLRDTPHPVVLGVPSPGENHLRPGEILEFSLLLLGPAVSALPFVCVALERMGERGLGSRRHRFSLEGITSPAGTYVYSPGRALSVPEPGRISGHAIPTGGSLRIVLRAPVRIKQGGCLLRTFDFQGFFENLCRRLQVLLFFYAGADLADLDWRPLHSLAGDAVVEEDGCRWHDWERYSTRQDRGILMGGLMGEIRLTQVHAVLHPVLVAGSVVGVGKGTVMGMGKYELRY